MDDSRIVEKMARRVIASEMRSYDSLSRVGKLRYEHAMAQPQATPLDLGVYQCAHGQWLYHVCAKCGRGPDEAMVYVRAMRSRVEELLSILEGH